MDVHPPKNGINRYWSISIYYLGPRKIPSCPIHWINISGRHVPKIRAQNTSIPSVYYKFIIVYMYIIPFDIHHAYIYTCILCKYIYIYVCTCNLFGVFLAVTFLSCRFVFFQLFLVLSLPASLLFAASLLFLILYIKPKTHHIIHKPFINPKSTLNKTI